MKKTFVSFVSCSLLTFSLGSFAEAATFSDVPADHRFSSEINELSSNGDIQGYSDGTFRPNQSVTRGEAAIIIGRFLGVEVSGGSNFTDISSSLTDRYVAAAKKQGYINGYTATSFKPSEKITRAELAIMLSKAFHLEESSASTLVFSDVSAQMAAYEEIMKMVDHRLTLGYPDGTFKPNQPVTRGELTAFLIRAAESLQTTGYVISKKDSSIWVVQHLTPNELESIEGKTQEQLEEEFFGKGIIFDTEKVEELKVSEIEVGQKVTVTHERTLSASAPAQGKAYNIRVVENENVQTTGYIISKNDNSIWVISNVSAEQVKGKTEEELKENFSGEGIIFDVKEVDSSVVSELKTGQKVIVTHESTLAASAPAQGKAFTVKIEQ